MKKYLLFLGLLLLPITVNASNANISLTASPKAASAGKNIIVTVTVSSGSPIGYYEYTLDYNHDKLQLVGGKAYNVEYANTANQKEFKKNYTFVVKDEGANKVSVKSYAVSTNTNESMGVTVNPVNINSSGNDEINQSDNNNLSTLKIENYKIEPSFNKNTTNYVATIQDSINEINIIAKAENKNASVIGSGKHIIKQGDNRIEVIVTSESGKDKIYTIKVRLSEKNIVKIKVDGENYNLVKSLDSYKDMKNYTIKKIKIDDNTIDSLYNSKADITLIGLKNENGRIKLFVYDSDKKTYTLYNAITSDSMSILPLKTEEKLNNYELYPEVINDSPVSCYKISSSSKFCALYGIDLDTGEKKWYTYDLESKTIEIFNNNDNNQTNNKGNIKEKDTGKLIYILSGTTLLFGITTIIFAIKSSKKRK